MKVIFPSIKINYLMQYCIKKINHFFSQFYPEIIFIHPSYFVPCLVFMLLPILLFYLFVFIYVFAGATTSYIFMVSIRYSDFWIIQVKEPIREEKEYFF